MKVHKTVTQANGIITAKLAANFTGDGTDATDRQKIAAFGDPLVNLAGTFVDPNDNTFIFKFATTEKYVGITTDMNNYGVNFMKSLPAQLPNQAPPVQQALDCITTDPARAVQIWIAILDTPTTGRIAASMATLRAMALLPTFTDTTI